MVTCTCCITGAGDSLSSITVKVQDLGFLICHADAGWISLDLSCILLLHLEFHFGSEYAFEIHFQLSSLPLLCFLCSQST